MKAHLPLRSLAVSGAALCALFLSACSTVKTRIAENPPAFYTLTPADQQMVERGGIREGFPRDVVYIAWGNPSTVQRTVVDGSESETWVYFGTESYPVGNYSYYPYRSGRYRYYRPIYDPVYVSQRYYLKSVTFVKGRVVAWDAPMR